MTGEDLSNGSKGIFGDEGEDGRPGKVPKFLRLNDELFEEVFGACDQVHVGGCGREYCGVRWW